MLRIKIEKCLICCNLFTVSTVMVVHIAVFTNPKYIWLHLLVFPP